MNEEVKAIMEAKEKAEKTQKEFDQLNLEYIEKNVDPKDWHSLDDAIMVLPESKHKLKVYDMMYDLKTNKACQEKIEELNKNIPSPFIVSELEELSRRGTTCKYSIKITAIDNKEIFFQELFTCSDDEFIASANNTIDMCIAPIF